MRETGEAAQLQTSPGAVAAGLDHPGRAGGRESLAALGLLLSFCSIRAPRDGR